MTLVKTELDIVSYKERRTSLSCLALMTACTWTGESVTCVNFTVSGCWRYAFYEEEMEHTNIITKSYTKKD